MHLNGTYGDHITLDLISQMYNVHIQVISLLGLQATININQQTGWQTMVLGHFVEGQGDHICWRSMPNFGCSEYKYDEPIPDTGNIQTELDKQNSDMDNILTECDEHNTDMDNIQTQPDKHNNDINNNQTKLDIHNNDMDNIQTELDQYITDIGDAWTELIGNMGDVQNELDKHISDNKSNWNLLPNKIRLKVIRAVLQQCSFKTNHICSRFATLNFANERFNELTQKRKDQLPRFYSNPELIPKPKCGKHCWHPRLNMKKFDSFSGVMFEIKQIVNFFSLEFSMVSAHSTLICHSYF